MAAIKTYTRVDYDRIKREGFNFVLPQETINAIKTIASNVGAPEYIKTPHFEKRTHKLRVQTKEISDTEWDNLRSFKATTFEKKKGIELSIDKIRKHLNKITDKTYDNLKLQIIEELEPIMKENDTDEHDELLLELNKIGDIMFDIASGNSFYSKIYATLYKELMSQYSFLETIFNTKISSDVSIFKDFTYCDPNKDYDTFCKNNKANEKRRALALFYVNLMLQGIVSEEKVQSMIEELQTDLLKNIKKESSANIVDEMSEVVFIMLVNGAHKLSKFKDNEWSSIIERITYISKLKPKSEPSISNKTVFKHMDLLTALKEYI
jgi:hypothetical protein